MASNALYIRYGKRCVDVVSAAIVLFLLAPLWLAIAMMVRLRFGAPIFHREERLGRAGCAIRILSFRWTKSPHVEPPTCIVGRLLQRTHLVALPRLWNVLRGDLSLVGPESLPARHQFRRRAVKPPAPTLRPGLFVVESEVLANDPSCNRFGTVELRYMERCSFFLDLCVICRSLASLGIVHRSPVRSSTKASDADCPLSELETSVTALASATDLMSRFGVIRIVGAHQETEWMEVLRTVASYDFHHLPSYHRLAEARGEGRAVLFAYREGNTVAAVPLLLRPLQTLPWAATDSLPKWDATSVYGYAGPVASRDGMEPNFAGRFRRALADALRTQGVISVFSRLDPMLEQLPLLRGLGQTPRVGETISIDVMKSDNHLLDAMHRMHRQDVRAFRRAGACLSVDESLRDLERFAEVYDENMRRVHAAQHYQFDLAYFHDLCRDQDHVKLLLVRDGNAIACGGLFLHTGDIVQYHLCGTALEYLPASPGKFLIFAACGWARERGAKILHLGGGLGGREDSLFQFKHRFGGATHPFHVWRWIVDADRYRHCCELRSQHDRVASHQHADPHFFPAYRRPIRMEG